MKKNKVISIALCALLCLFVVLSFGLLVAESGHHCVGEDCQICLEIEACISIINHFAPVAAAAFFTALAGVFAWIAAGFFAVNEVFDTLVMLKVKLTI